MREWLASLSDARDYATRCARYATGIDLETFLTDGLRREAICFCIVIIGEAFNSIPRVLQNRVPQIPWAGVIGMRNRLIHEYWNIDFETVFRAAINDAERLADQIDMLMQQSA
jgi:uncharacterized protein with HEPN domain